MCMREHELWTSGYRQCFDCQTQVVTEKDLMPPCSIHSVYGPTYLTSTVPDLGGIVCCCLEYPKAAANYWLMEMHDSVEEGSNVHRHKDSLFNLKTEACYNLT